MREPTEMETRCNEAAKKAYNVDRKPLGIAVTRAIIRELLVPTQDMLDAGDSVGTDNAEDIFPAMIDAASPEIK